MTTSTPADRTAAATNARRARTQAMINRVRSALDQMHRERAPITIAAVARCAHVSRTFLYQNPIAHSLVTTASTAASDQQLRDQAAHRAHLEASWRERALNAENALTRARQEITNQRATIAELLGQIRDLENALPKEAAQHLVTENTTLKQGLHQLTQERQRLREQLHSARENNRFLDKRIADLEAQLVSDLTDTIRAKRG
ncbi:DUF6262 family protein [Nocardia sp. R7R-8]|uniref:DUF6262 family protein n=1 Tax=Nocardia sp. R7R-8 TaxID=3459304 RepID=UPI00403D7CBE